MLFTRKQLLQLLLPLMVEQLLTATVGIADSMMAVSYTHLDVYKRQAMDKTRQQMGIVIQNKYV